MSNVLNLSGASTKGFDPIPSARYDAKVFEVESIEIEKEDGKLPKGTPGMNVQFVIDGGEYDNRRLWRRLYFPPESYPKAKELNDMLAQFLVAIGYPESEVTSGEFVLNYEDMAGRPCTITVSQRTYDGEIYNDVKAVRARGEATVPEGTGGIL